MKKEIIILIILALLLPLAIAANDPNNSGEDKEIEDEMGEVTDIGKEAKERTDSILYEKIEMPKTMEKIMEIIFAIDSNDLTYQFFTILLAVFIMLFLVINSTVKIMPFFEGWTALIGSVVIACLFSISGGTKSVAIFFMNLGNIFGILEEWSPLTILATLIIGAIIVWAGMQVSKIIRKKYGLMEAEKEGMEAGAGMKMAESMYKTQKDLE